MVAWGGASSRWAGSLQPGWNEQSGCVTVVLGSELQIGRLMILLGHLGDQYRALVCGAEGNCQLSVGDGLLGCTWKLRHAGLWSLKTDTLQFDSSLLTVYCFCQWLWCNSHIRTHHSAPHRTVMHLYVIYMLYVKHSKLYVTKPAKSNQLPQHILSQSVQTQHWRYKSFRCRAWYAPKNLMEKVIWHLKQVITIILRCVYDIFDAWCFIWQQMCGTVFGFWEVKQKK